MAKINLEVGLKIPDTTAITAFHALERMGKNIKHLGREDYFEFDVTKDSDKFMEEIVKIDIIVNANKNYANIKKGDNIEVEPGKIYVLVTNSDDNYDSLLSTLKDNMGLKNLKSVSKGVLWKLTLDTKDKEESLKIAKDIVESLLYNPHYQEYKIFS